MVPVWGATALLALGACSSNPTPFGSSATTDDGGGSSSGSNAGSSSSSSSSSNGAMSSGSSDDASSGELESGPGGARGNVLAEASGDDGASTVTPGSFRHPGVLVNGEQLAFLKMKVAAGAAPWAPALTAAKADSHASLSYTAAPPSDSNGDVGCGSYSSPDIHCGDEKKDVSAAYTDALIWALTGDKQYAAKAIEIMNAWSAVMKSHSLSNTIVQTGWTGTVFARAAEIIRYTNAGWAQADIDKFSSMLKTAYVPYIKNGAPKENGNWELSATDALIQIAVFLDDKTLFDAAVALWKGRVPAYIYMKADGASPAMVPNQGSSWNGATQYFDGLCQETCRDLGHTQYGFAAMINAAETARIQGVDLYALEAARITTSLELHAGYINNGASSSPACSLSAVTADMTWEIAYNEYANRLKMALPNTLKVIGTIRPTGIDHHMDWETLTHAEVGGVGIH
jgi:hypothetical protein